MSGIFDPAIFDPVIFDTGDVIITYAITLFGEKGTITLEGNLGAITLD